MANKGLTIKQERYAQNLFAGMSQREAYKDAYSTKNMSDKSIDEEACRLANDLKITTRVAELTEELKQKNMLTVQKVVDELSHIAFDDIKNYLDYRTEKTVVGNDELGNPITDYETIIDLKDSRTIDTRNIKSVSLGKNGFKFEQYCKDNALVQLGKHLGMFTENVKLSGGLNNVNENHNYDESQMQAIRDSATPEQLAVMDAGDAMYIEVEASMKQK